MDIDKILNLALNKALIGKDRIKQVNSNEIADFVNKHLVAINYTHSCTLLVCVDDNDLPNLTKEKEYEMLAETNRHYNIIDDNENDVLISKKYFRQLKKAN